LVALKIILLLVSSGYVPTNTCARPERLGFKEDLYARNGWVLK